ncbi:flippase [Lactiplantibacillus garii]|uniref:Flippase n=1 Tax=Lactiplantibacillus garii TaxID=2306423 RepID=A0A426D3L7_9LACO|nr:flippase [Lactiplantibacillus garii]RRK09273.1 flippase [Lactiplantibacillus garii]
MKVVRNYLYNAGYQLLNLIVPFITVPYIARVLGPKGVGINSYTNSIITYFLLLGTLGITVYGNREIAYHRDDIKERSRIFWEIEFLQLITIVIAYALFLGFDFFQTQYKAYFLLQSLWIIAGAFDISWLFMGMEDFKKTVLRNTLVKLISLAAIFLFVKTANDVGVYIFIIGIAQVLGNLTLWPYLPRVIQKPVFKGMNVWRHLGPTTMLFIPQVAAQVYLQLNKTMLGQFDSVIASGYYDYADKLVKMALAVITATGTVMLPHMSNLAAKGDMKRFNNALYKSFSFVSFLAIPLTFGIAAVATTLAPWYYGEQFAIVGRLIIIESPVAILIGWSNVIGLQYLMPLKRVKSYTKSVTYGAIINIVINIPLIVSLGVNGATIATVISESVVTGYQFWVVRHDIRFSRLFVDAWKYFVAAIIMFIVVYLLNCMMVISIGSLTAQIVEGILIYIGVLLVLQASIIVDGLQLLGKKF